MKLIDFIQSVLIKKIGRTSTAIDLSFKYGFTSGVLMDYVYQNRSSGKYFIGKLIDRIFLNNIGWQAVRERKSNLMQCIMQIIDNKGRLNIFDMACGPGSYLIDALSQRNSNKIKVICQDLNDDSLKTIKTRLDKASIYNAKLVKGSLFDKIDSNKSDLVIVAGVYEWMINDDDVKRSMAVVESQLEPGGDFLFTHLSGHKQLSMVENTFIDFNQDPVRMKIRDNRSIAMWAEELNLIIYKQIQDENGLHTVTWCKKK
jgi:SAM-dependent methyltransferase